MAFKISPLRRLYLDLNRSMDQSQVVQLKGLLLDDQIPKQEKESAENASDIFILLEDYGYVSQDNLGFLKELLENFKMPSLIKKISDCEKRIKGECSTPLTDSQDEQDTTGEILSSSSNSTRKRSIDSYSDTAPQIRKSRLSHTRDVSGRSESVDINGDVLTYNGNTRVGGFIASSPLSPDHNYFEVEILDTGYRNTIGVGLAPQDYSLSRQPGWDEGSVGYHSDNGFLYIGSGRGTKYATVCKKGDVIGCGIQFNEELSNKLSVFFTKNNEELRTVNVKSKSDLHPAVGLHSGREKVKVTLGLTWNQRTVASQ
ncbi:uncharacterized protein LOC144439053 [Glandiceps talaboti]